MIDKIPSAQGSKQLSDNEKALLTSVFVIAVEKKNQRIIDFFCNQESIESINSELINEWARELNITER